MNKSSRIYFALPLVIAFISIFTSLFVFSFYFFSNNNVNSIMGKPSSKVTGEFVEVSEVYNLDTESNYDVINPQSQITSPVFYICQDNVKTYSSPEARDEWVSGEIGRGEVIRFSSVSNAHWVLISVDPTIEYVDMVNVCKQ